MSKKNRRRERTSVRGILPAKRQRVIPRDQRYGRTLLDSTLAENDDPKTITGRDVHHSDLVRVLRALIDYAIAHVEVVEDVQDLSADQLLEILTGVAGLTDQQRRVLELRLDGHSSREIAEALDVSRRTVRIHLERAITKLRLAHDTEAA